MSCGRLVGYSSSSDEEEETKVVREGNAARKDDPATEDDGCALYFGDNACSETELSSKKLGRKEKVSSWFMANAIKVICTLTSMCPMYKSRDNL